MNEFMYKKNGVVTHPPPMGTPSSRGHSQSPKGLHEHVSRKAAKLWVSSQIEIRHHVCSENKNVRLCFVSSIRTKGIRGRLEAGLHCPSVAVGKGVGASPLESCFVCSKLT
ncbi:hypothetical protein JTE90_024093 [Oedothorax gibbosus]|uniref:Uncharacterized protein n=1 Tax=Oedothorax gibbosus TaxID=931172 RepID=A0AAV6UQV3_9ARAC|nr:hypothetical protein JTE90_024093 [Oedothorax gibbosus]